MRAKILLQMASFGALAGLLVSPVLAQNSGPVASAPMPVAGPGFGFGSEALQPTEKAAGAAKPAGKAIDQTPGGLTQSPAAKSPQTPMAKAAPSYDDVDSSPSASASASDDFSQPAAKSDRMAKVAPSYDDADSYRGTPSSSDDFSEPSGKATGSPNTTAKPSSSGAARSDHMAKADSGPEYADSPRSADIGAGASAPMAGAAGTPATSRSVTGQALGAAGQAIGGTAGQALEGLGQAFGPPQPLPGTTMGNAPRY